MTAAAFSSLDNFFLQRETARCPAHWSLIVDLDTDGTAAITLEELRERVRARISAYPVFRHGASGTLTGRPAMRHYDLEAALSCVSAAEVSDEQDFRGLVSVLLGQPLTRDRPSWRLLLVDQQQPRRQRLVLLVHHAMVDGVAGAGYAALFIDGDETQLRQLDRYVCASRYPVPPVPLKAFGKAGKALVAGWGRGARSERLPKLRGPRRAVATLQIPTTQVRRAAAAVEAGTAEFLVAAIGASVADTVAGSLPAGRRPATLRAFMPYTLDTDLRHWGNAVSMVLVNQPGAAGVELRERITVARSELTAISENATALALPAVAQLTGRLPWIAQRVAARTTMEVMAPDLHIGVNPGYVKLESVLGRGITAIHPLSPLLGNPLSFTCLVLGAAVHIGIVWDPDALGDGLGEAIGARMSELVPGEQIVVC